MNLEAQWIVGFVDSVGEFHISLKGDEVLPKFSVVRKAKDIHVLYALKTYFGCGVVRKHHAVRVVYYVRDVKHLIHIIVPFFEKHLLKTSKRIEFQNFRKILLIMYKGGHLSPEEFEKIRALKAKIDHRQTKIESDFIGNDRE